MSDLSQMTTEQAMAYRIQQARNAAARQSLEQEARRQQERYEAAKKREAEYLAERKRQSDEAAAARAEAEMEERRQDALRTWLAGGGSESEFKSEWPKLRRELLRSAVLDRPTEMERIKAAKLASGMYSEF